MKEEYDELIEQLKKILPFEAYPTRELVVELRGKWKITLKTVVKVINLHNLVEAGGISCALEGLEHLEDGEEEVVICGLTHLIMPTSNPLYSQITKYQIKRSKWLAKQR
jgi:hypothetical protein